LGEQILLVSRNRLWMKQHSVAVHYGLCTAVAKATENPCVENTILTAIL